MSDDQIFAKCAWRLIPFTALLYVVSYIDRVNVGFAALTMNKDLGFSPSVYGLGAGILFISYAFCQVPSSMILVRVGARRWIFSIMAVWGALSAGTAFVRTPLSFYALRFLLGAAESGFFVGIVFYLTLWFPERQRARCIAGFQTAIPLAFVLGAPISGLILDREGMAGLHGWQWLFLIEGLPAFLLAFAVLRLLPDSPAHAPWLSIDEKALIAKELGAEDSAKSGDFWSALHDFRFVALGLSLFGTTCGMLGIQLWLPQIVQGMGFSNAATGFIVSVPALAAVPAMVLWGRSSDRRNERIGHAAAAMLLAAAAFGVASVVDNNLLELGALIVAFVAPLAVLPVLNTLPLSFLRGSAAAGGIAFYNMFGLLGGFAGPYALGALREATGAYASGLAALAIAMAASASIVLALGRAMAARAAMQAGAA
jgi:MFS transporter, ACS family, tartrate transporter